MKKLSRKVGTSNYDNLIAGLEPAVQVFGGTLEAQEKETVIERGTLLSKNEDASLSVYDGTKVPYAILCDSVTAGTEDTSVVIYLAGCFNENKIIGADKLTEAHRDELRKYNIALKSMLS